MIEKLKSKIFWIIMISFSVVIVGTMVLVTTLNYTNTISSATSMIDRMADFRGNRPNNPNMENDINNEMKIDGLYSITVENGEVSKRTIITCKNGNNVEVVLKKEKEKGNVILKVENEGSKIPEEEREKIFERFYRVDKSRNRSEKRYVLGLAIAKSTVEKYKGRINVGYKNGYTIFEVIIPA